MLRSVFKIVTVLGAEPPHPTSSIAVAMDVKMAVFVSSDDLAESSFEYILCPPKFRDDYMKTASSGDLPPIAVSLMTGRVRG